MFSEEHAGHRISPAKAAELRRKAENNLGHAREHEKLGMHGRAGAEFRNAAEIHEQLAEELGSKEDSELARRHYKNAGLSFMTHAHFMLGKIETKSRLNYKASDVVEACESAMECFGKAGDKVNREAAERLLRSSRASDFVQDMAKHSKLLGAVSGSIAGVLKEAKDSGIDLNDDPKSRLAANKLLRTIEDSVKGLGDSKADIERILGKKGKQRS